MGLSDLEKNSLTEEFLALFKQRLTGKDQPVLPPSGLQLNTTAPTIQNILGTIANQPNPDFGGTQPPNYIGKVLLVTPDCSGKVTCSLKGRFDVSHRYIPDIDHMLRELAYDKGVPRATQRIVPSYKRFSVPFEDIELTFDVPADLLKWVSSDAIEKNQLAALDAQLAQDPRIFKSCQLYPRNQKAKIDFHYSESMRTQDDLNAIVINEIFENGATSPLDYKVEVKGRLRPAPPSLTKLKGGLLLEISLTNRTESAVAQTYGLERPYLLDCVLETELTAGNHHLLPHKLKPEDYRLYEGDGLEGYGINCAVEKTEQGNFITNCLPVVQQPTFETPTPEDVGMSVKPTFEALADNPLPVLEELIEALKRYRQTWLGRIGQMKKDGHLEEASIAEKEVEAFQNEIENVQRGCTLLSSHAELCDCFRWMNAAMKAGIERQGKPFKGWRLFQLGFILTQIEAIYERYDGVQTETPSWDTADILWFSTGGGKTEAYLGLICMGMLYGRLKGREYGTTAWLRFPLRMLSVQQFQRLSYVVAQANILRQEKALGGHPFTIGYFTGTGTPSHISSPYDDQASTFLPTISSDRLKSLRFINDCPYCDEKHSIEVIRDLTNVRVKHVCKNEQCWSNTHASEGVHGEGIRGEIGIYVSDEECYRYLPTIMVGTVDRLAVIAHNIRFSKFFGSAKHYCPTHGFITGTKCDYFRFGTDNAGQPTSVRCGNNTRTSVVKTVILNPMLDPGFQFTIQDELHLLRELLGNFNGHYETLLQTLQVLHGGHPPKILAATATIKDYQHHIHHLYQKAARRYPAPGINEGESFYSRRKDSVRRYFTSLLPITQNRNPMRTVSDVSSRFLDLVDELRAALAADLTGTAQKLNIPALKAVDALNYLEDNLNTNLMYVNKKRNISEIEEYLAEEAGSRGVDRYTARLDGESSLDEIQDAIEHVETKTPGDPLRQLIATSVISHGVDIERLNFMILAGCPTSTAEYIQASARAGRVHPGIVLTMLSYYNLYEHNVFLNFSDYHMFMEKMVESVPINRFAPNVLERTLPGIMSAIVLNWAVCQPWFDGTRGNMAEVHKVLNEGGVAIRELERAALAALYVSRRQGAEWFDPRVVKEFTENLKTEVQRGLNRLETWSGTQLDMQLSEALKKIYRHPPFRSFRDIERQVSVLPARPTDEEIFSAFRR